MAGEEEGVSSRGAAIAVGAVLILAVLATRVLWWGNPAATVDEQLYALIGGQLAEGRLPYVELWDRKPFGLFALFAAGEWLGWLTGLQGPRGIQLLAGVFTLAGSWLAYLLARTQVDRVTACGAGVLYAVLISLYGGWSSQSEVFHAPLMLAMAWLVLDGSALHYSRRAVIAMLIGGIALQVKYTVVPQCLFFGLVALWQLHKHGFGWPRLVAMALLFAIMGLAPTFAVGLLYWGAGAFEAFWFANFESFFLRDGAGRFLRTVQAAILPLAGLALAGAYLAFRGKPLRNPAIYLLFLGWALAAAATVFLPGTVYVYYFGALAAPVILVSLPLLDRHGPLRDGPLALVIAASVWLLGPVADWQTSRASSASLEQLAQQISPLVDDQAACLWVHDGPTALYTMTQSCLPTRFIYPDHLNNALENDAALGISQTGEALRILGRKPSVIVTAEETLTPQNQTVRDALHAALDAEYEELGRAESGYREVAAYVRRDLAAR